MTLGLTRILQRLGPAIIVIAVTASSAAHASRPGFDPAAVTRPSQRPSGQNQANVIEIRADAFGLPLTDHASAEAYDKPAVYLQEGDTISFTVPIEEEGPYTVAFDVAAPDSFLVPPEGQLLVDGATPSEETPRIIFPVFYGNSKDEFPLDRYGNEALSRQETLVRWTKVAMRDADFSQRYPQQIALTPGEHSFEFQLTQESLLVGSIYLEPFAPYPTYSEYLQDNQGPAASDVLIELEAEHPSFKNDTAIRPANSRSLAVTPYHTSRLLLNTLGGANWGRSGSTVFYEFTVPQDGMYLLTLRSLQDVRNNFTVFRRITINDRVLFDELNVVPFNYSTEWSNTTLGGADAPYQLYLEEGVNVLGIEATNAPYSAATEKITSVLVDINELSLDIKKLTGNQSDAFKEWVISDYIPDIKEQLLSIAADLSEDLEGLRAIQGSGGSQEVLTYQMAIDNILELAEDPDEIPARMGRFSEGSGSAAQLLASLLPLLQSQPLALDKLYIHSPDSPPPPVETSPVTSFAEGAKRFFLSFMPNPYQSLAAGEGELEVWVNRPRQYVDLLQLITDESFTAETGIRVKYSIMPDEQKLVLANAAGIQPDVALGVSTNRPYELAVRNALTDLRSFDDFDSFINVYRPGALLSYVINDSVYAIPETQDFWVTFYRRDVMESLGIPVPETWDEVIEILPELQRFGLNYSTALSSGTGSKGYLATAPYLFNHDAPLYANNGFATGLGSEEAIEAVQFMAESFTIYGMPTETPNFYDSFRNGSLPIGVSNIETYLKLMTAAPELNGLWEIAPYPATVLEDGTELRYATGSAQASIMFANTDQKESGWEFLKWWMSTETQIDFQQQLILNYGMAYLWNSANVEAFAASPIPDEHKAVILEQWEWLQEPLQLPGSYMQERELSNTWNRIVFDGMNPRVAIDTAVVTINREITRKMEEFGYLEDGKVVKEFKIPTIETIEGWMEGAR